MDWDDIRFFLAVIEHGSTKRAAAALRVNQTTCARRISALEASLGLQLFDTQTGRYLPTRNALDLVESAKAMQSAAERLSDQVRSRRRNLRRELRITTEETLARQLVTPAVARFMRLHPDVQVEIDVSTDLRDLVAGEADIAVRGGVEPTQGNLIRRKIADDPFGFYCSSSYPSPPAVAADLPNHPIGCFDVALARLQAYGLGPSVKHVTNSALTLKTLVQQGDAVGLLPRSVAMEHPPLRLCFELPIPIAIWILYPERLRGSPDLRKLVRVLVEERKRLAFGKAEQMS